MKYIFLIIIIFNVSILSCQNLVYGKYESKQGSELILKSDITFSYLRSSYMINSDVISIFREYEAYGSYKEKNGFLYMKSDSLTLENNIERGIEFNIIELENDIKKTPNFSNSVSVNFDENLISVYLCNTGNEVMKDFDDTSFCYKLKKKNKLESNFEEFFIRVYPNLDNYKVRDLYSPNTLYFDSKQIRKEIENDLEIIIDFNIENFDLEYFNQELLLIKDGKIYHEGQEFVLSNK